MANTLCTVDMLDSPEIFVIMAPEMVNSQHVRAAREGVLQQRTVGLMWGNSLIRDLQNEKEHLYSIAV